MRSLPQRSGVDFAYGGTRYDAGGQMTIYRYTGQRVETGTGLYDYGARWYDPYLNRWLQPDTIVPEPGNWYAWRLPSQAHYLFADHHSIVAEPTPSGKPRREDCPPRAIAG